MAKIGRNQPCPCGSGRKYKKCHGRPADSTQKKTGITPEIRHQFQLAAAKERQRASQQGLGRPIISATIKGHRIVAVGSEIFWSSNWKTFHDFLFHYVAHVLGVEWGHKEKSKPPEKRHPIMQWHDALQKLQAAAPERKSGVRSAPMNGAALAYLNLAYNLYLLAHNASLQKRLIVRLKTREQFHGAYYETYVAAHFIKAGFEIALENEQEGGSTHCEFVATHTTSKEKYSVEAKARDLSSQHDPKDARKLIVGRQLHKALSKKADHTRIVFIDVNVAEGIQDNTEIDSLPAALDILRREEATMMIERKPAPSAYVFVTNFPYHHDPAGFQFKTGVIAEGFKIPDFKLGARFASLRDAVTARDKHADLSDLMAGMENHRVPSTFDGEAPDFAFGEGRSERLIIGNKYIVPDETGNEIAGIMEEGAVVESEKTAYGIFKLEDGRRVIVTIPLSDEEISVYREFPDTFFGVYKQTTRKPRDDIDLYDMLFETYKETPRELFLDWFANAEDFSELQTLPQIELAKIYCERAVYSRMRDRKHS